MYIDKLVLILSMIILVATRAWVLNFVLYLGKNIDKLCLHLFIIFIINSSSGGTCVKIMCGDGDGSLT